MDLEDKTLAMICRDEHYEFVREQAVYCGSNNPAKCVYSDKCLENGDYHCMKLDRMGLWKFYVEVKKYE